MTHPRFHLAIPVSDLAGCRHFYGDTLGFPEGRSDTHWVDFDMFGHQLVIHEVAGGRPSSVAGTNPVDGDDVPVPHFGVLLPLEQWEQLAQQLVDASMEFVIDPHVRFAGEKSEQHTMFFLDPSGNALEFKSFTDDDQVFST